MKFPIRFKLFTALSLLILFFVILSWILNNIFLEKYYSHKKASTLMHSYKFINDLYKRDSEEMFFELEKLERMKGLQILVVDKDFEVVYSSFHRRLNMEGRIRERSGILNDVQNLPEYIIKSRAQEVTQGKIVIENRNDRRLNTNFINLFSRLNNGDYIFLSTPVAVIEESVDITNSFFLFTGIITIITGSIFIFLLTGRFTDPILKLNNIAQRMSTLDFSRRYEVKTNDEIGELGQSINSLSEQLEKSIMELKSANKQLKEDIERKHRIDEMRKEFISSVSHELKTPIALIQGYAEGLKVNVNEDEENKNFYCDVIVDESFKMNKLVKQLLDLSQLEAGELHLEKSNFDIIQLTKQIVKKSDLLFRGYEIDISFEDNKNIMVNADYDRVEQVLNNYINNAINYVDDKKLIKIKASRRLDKAIVSIFNSGKHIKEEYMEKIWTSFYKIDRARTREYGGSGLGLSIVRAIQEAHNNDYGVRNIDGGVEFWFELDLI